MTISTGEQSPTIFEHAPNDMFSSYVGVDLIGNLPNGDAYLHIESLDTILDSDLTNIAFNASPWAMASNYL